MSTVEQRVGVRAEGAGGGQGGQPGDLDPHDVRIVADPPATLAPFNRAGVLGPADVHGARTLCDIAGENRAEVLLATALALRAPQHGHVCVELSTVAGSVTGLDEAPVAVDELDWPDATTWSALVADSPLVSVRPTGTPEVDPRSDRPLSLVGERLYLDRYWRYERRVAEVLRRRAERVDPDVDPGRVRAALDRLLPPPEHRPDRQRVAVASGALRGLTVIAGGPGTGKTHTVARLLALLHELSGERWPRVAVAAPTGKAADRLTVALRDAAEEANSDDRVRRRLRTLEASTLHRLLGWHPGSRTRFRHGREHKLPHEIVVVDETSMVDLPLMAKLVSALRPATKLVLVGDPDQLASVEAGAVLADIVGPTGDELRLSGPAAQLLQRASGEPLDRAAPPPDTDDGRGAGSPNPDAGRADGMRDAIVVLGRVRRYAPGSGIARLAAAVRAGDPDAAIEVLRADTSDLTWIERSGEAAEHPDLAPARERIVAAQRDVVAAAQAGRAAEALRALDAVRVLCAHRRGPVGVAWWVPLIERWLTEEVDDFDPRGRWYVGRPVLVTRNEPRMRLFNGDVGVTVRTGETAQVAFRGADGVRLVAPSRLEEIETVHAMTIHKSQGSQFDHVVAVLADERSPILTRELLYTAVTRARRGVTIVGTEASLRHGIARQVTRASGLRETLWGAEPAPGGEPAGAD